MLHNSHLWTINETITGRINAYQRRLLRQLLNIRWPKKISNDQHKASINYIEWSKTIETTRIRWIGHLLRMPENTTARIALEEAERTVRMPRGRHKITWLKCAEEQLAKLNITWENAKVLALDRNYWKSLTRIEGKENQK